jgi:glycosyltransferase involved in cell wall biosynthesis
MKIAILGTRYSPPYIRGGVEAVIHDLKRGFESRGNHVDVFTPAFRKWSEIDQASPASNVHRLPVPSIRFVNNFIFSKKLNSFLSGKSYDVILNMHAHLGCLIRVRPHIITVATTSFGEARSMVVQTPMRAIEWLTRKTLGFWFERRSLRRCDRIVCVADHIRKDLQGEYGLLNEKMVCIGNGVDCEKFSPAIRERKSSHCADPPIIVYAGRLAPRKNVERLIRAADLLRERLIRFKLRICGEGEERTRVERLCGDLGLSHAVEFAGRVPSDRLPDEYRRASVFVLPSRYEGVPLVLLESQACGVPACVADFPGVESVIEDGKNGLVVVGEGPTVLADALARLLKNAEERSSMGQLARTRMIEGFSWDRIVDDYLRLFEDCVSEAKAR